MKNGSWWFAYECIAGHHGGNGVVLDVRADNVTDPPTVACPLCTQSMDFRGCWESSPGGYAGRSSSDADVALDILRDGRVRAKRFCCRETIAATVQTVEEALEQRHKGAAGRPTRYRFHTLAEVDAFVLGALTAVERRNGGRVDFFVDPDATLRLAVR